MEHNCTTPYGPNKNFICTDIDKGMLASKLYTETFENYEKRSKQNCQRLLEVTKGKAFTTKIPKIVFLKTYTAVCFTY